LLDVNNIVDWRCCPFSNNVGSVSGGQALHSSHYGYKHKQFNIAQRCAKHSRAGLVETHNHREHCLNMLLFDMATLALSHPHSAEHGWLPERLLS
jgi:hypothetical protein